MQNKKLLAFIILGFIGVSAAIYFSKRHVVHPIGKTSPHEKTTMEIMTERSLQASKQLDTPLGKAIVSKNWQEVNSLYHPESNFIQLGEIIRALFIEQKMKTFTLDDQEKLTTLVLGTFDKMPEKNLHLSGMLVSQFERLPSPKQGSMNFKILKKWIHDPEEQSLKRKLGIIKLVLQDAIPDKEAAALYQKTLINGDTLGQQRNEWIQEIDEIRSHPVQEEALESIAKNFKKITPDAQPAALLVLSRHLEIKPEQTKTLTLQYLKSADLAKVEAALKALVPLLHENLLNPAEKDAVANTLTNFPTPVRTPFVELKSSQILKLLGHT